MNEKLQTAVCCAGFIFGVYAVYVFSNMYCYGTVPDGPLFAGILAIIGLVFGYNFRAAVEKRAGGTETARDDPIDTVREITSKRWKWDRLLGGYRRR